MNDREALAELKAGKLRPVYLVYGEEPFLKEQLLRAVDEAVLDPALRDANYDVVNPGSDQLDRALGLASTHTFFGRRLVVVKESPIFSAARKRADDDSGEEEKPAGDDERLLRYLGQPVESTCLLFLCGDSVDSRKKVTKAIIATGGVVECKAMKEQDALLWAQQRARGRYEKEMNDLAAHALMERLGADLQLIDSELNKLSLYVGTAKRITAEDVERTVLGVAETEIYRLTEAVMLKERTKALAYLAQTLRQVDHPLQALAALTNRFRQILTVKALVARGLSAREGAGAARMHPYAYEKMVGHVRHYPREAVVAALHKLLEADLAMKSGQEPRLVLETLVVELVS